MRLPTCHVCEDPLSGQTHATDPGVSVERGRASLGGLGSGLTPGAPCQGREVRGHRAERTPGGSGAGSGVGGRAGEVSSARAGSGPELRLGPLRPPQNYELTLHEGTYKAVQRGPGGALPYRVRYEGTHLAIEARSGLVVSWDRKTSVRIRLQQHYKVRARVPRAGAEPSPWSSPSAEAATGGWAGPRPVGAPSGAPAPDPPTVRLALGSAPSVRPPGPAPPHPWTR